MDPSSGTAIMMEVGRVLGSRLRAGWRPRRSIVLASWAAEEAGIMGSAEWVYDKVHKLMSRSQSRSPRTTPNIALQGSWSGQY